jgi:hypothetical protein
VRAVLRIVLLACSALALAGCIQSSGPIMSDASPVFGPKLKLQLYGLRDGYARDPEMVTFTWNGALYARTSGGLRDVAGFTAHSFESGDFIIQSVPVVSAKPIEFAIAHKLAGGVWQVIPIDEADADEATRTASCKKEDRVVCAIEGLDQLIAFARATAARRNDSGGLAIRLPDDGERRRRGVRR